MDRRAQLFRTLITQIIIVIFMFTAPSVIKFMVSSLDSGSSNTASVNTNQSGETTGEAGASAGDGSDTDPFPVKDLAKALEPVLSTVQWLGVAGGMLMIGVTGFRIFTITLTGESYEPARASAYESSARRQAEEAQPDLADSLESMLASNEASSENGSASRIVGEERSASTQREDKTAKAAPQDAVTRVIRDVDPKSNSSEEVKEDAEIKRIIRS